MKRYVSLPDDITEQALESYVRFGIDIVTRRDRNGNSSELLVPYCSGGLMRTYKIIREGDDVRAKPFRSRSQCRLNRQEKQKLLALFQKIENAELSREPEKGPHTFRIVT